AAGDPVPHQVLALLEAAGRYIGDEARARIAQELGVTRAHRRFDDAIADRLDGSLATFDREEHAALRLRLRHRRALYHLDPRCGGAPGKKPRAPPYGARRHS